MDREHFTPVVPARHLVAANARPGDRVAVNLDQCGSYPFEVTQCREDDDGVVLQLRQLCVPEPREGTAIVPRDHALAVLAAHFGLCGECGRLSPCPDELAERRLENLWHQDPDPSPTETPAQPTTTQPHP